MLIDNYLSCLKKNAYVHTQHIRRRDSKKEQLVQFNCLEMEGTFLKWSKIETQDPEQFFSREDENRILPMDACYLILSLENEDVGDASEGYPQVDDLGFRHLVRDVADVDHLKDSFIMPQG